MNIIMGLALIAIGLAAIFYMRPKMKNNSMEMKYMQTKKISELQDMFSQMDASGMGNDYREYVELKGNVVTQANVETPFSSKKVAYCESKLSQVTEVKEQYRDANGNYNTRTNKAENVISDEKTSQEISMTDGTGEVVLEVNATGCELDIPTTFDRFEPKNNLSGYRYFNRFSWDRFGAETLGFRMIEKTINLNQSLYVIGEAFRVGNVIHIGKPMDAKKPFIVSTKSEEDMVNTSDKNSKFALFVGMAAIVRGIVVMFFIKRN